MDLDAEKPLVSPLRYPDADGEVQRSFQNQVPQEPPGSHPRRVPATNCWYLGGCPRGSFLMPRRPCRRQPLIKCCDYSHLEPRWHSSFAKHRQFKHNSCFMGNKRQSFVNLPHLEKDGCEGSLPLCPPQSLKKPPFFWLKATEMHSLFLKFSYF